MADRYSGRDTVGQSFLEKIVQVPLHLPAPDGNILRTLALNGVDGALAIAHIELSKEQSEAFVVAFDLGLRIMLTTPRMVRRFANILQFALPLLRDEVHPADLMLMEGVRLFYPKMYKTIRDNPWVFSAGEQGSVQSPDYIGRDGGRGTEAARSAHS